MPAPPPIFRFNEARDAIVEEVVRRACDAVADARLALSEGAFLEVKRQQSGRPDDVVPLGEWRSLARSLAHMSDTDCSECVREIATRYARDVAGNFDPRVYKFATRTIAPLIGMLMSPMQTMRHLGGAFDLRASTGVSSSRSDRDDSLSDGEGTVVFVPTHLSNLDSVVFGFALARIGLPPATYGRERTSSRTRRCRSSCTTWEPTGRSPRDPRALQRVLKAYSCVVIERGYTRSFSPAGLDRARARSSAS